MDRVAAADGRLPHEPAPDLSMQRAAWQADPDGQLPQGQMPVRGELKIAVVRHGDLFAMFVGWFSHHSTCNNWTPIFRVQI